MQDEIARLRQFWLRGTEGPAPSPLDTLFERVPPKQAVQVLVKACEGLSTRELGFQVFPRLKGRLQRDEALLRELTHLIADTALEEPFRLVLMDFVDSVMRRKGERESYWKTLRKVCTSDADPLPVRARAMRNLGRDASPATTKALEDLLRSGKPELLNAAAHVARGWHRRGLPVPKNTAATLAAFARASPHRALQFPSLVRALAELSSPEGEEALHLLVEKSNTAEERAMLVGAAGAALSPRLLARLEQSAREDASPLFTEVLQAAVAQQAISLDTLKAAGFDEARLDQLRAASEALPAPEAHEAAGESAPQALSGSSQAVVEAYGHATGFHQGDAIYRDLLTRITNEEHWHTAIYLGFSYTSFFWIKSAAMTGINATEPITDTVQFFSATTSRLGSPESNVLEEMINLRNAFITAFREGRGPEVTFHGARTIPGITPEQRAAVVTNAHSLYGKGIAYTFADMLDYEYWDWDGTPEDIDETRCDGLVEYAYEKSGLRVCSGKDAARWNISTPGTGYPENHNDFHTYDYNHGELCPRIQAGNHGHGVDSAFIYHPGSAPMLSHFSVTPGPHGPVIRFRVASDAYRTSLVRLTVARQGGPFHFVRTENPFGTTTPGIAGSWEFLRVRTNTSSDLVANWMGKTVGGPSWGGQNGPYIFRLVSVDEGGSVSTLQSISIDISWPGSLHLGQIA